MKNVQDLNIKFVIVQNSKMERPYVDGFIRFNGTQPTIQEIREHISEKGTVWETGIDGLTVEGFDPVRLNEGSEVWSGVVAP